MSVLLSEDHPLQPDGAPVPFVLELLLHICPDKLRAMRHQIVVEV